MSEHIANKGYIAVKKESSKGTAVIPDVYALLYEESMAEMLNVDQDTPIAGNKAATFQVLPGMREHRGDITVLAEPNTAARFFDMLLTISGTTGSGPYTHAFGLSNATNPNSYTMDIQKGQVVQRYMGVEASAIAPAFDSNKMTLKITLSALKSFSVREIASVNSADLTLTTGYDPIAPTAGLVVNDLVRIFKANGTVLDTTVSAVTDTVVTVASASGVAGGDKIALRAATPSLNVATPFLWSRSQFRFGATASDALSATQTRLEQGSSWTISHAFEDEGGAKRSGSFDPEALVRKLGNAEFNLKQYFDSVDDYNRFLSLTKRACVIRHYSETGYELRITLNNIKASEHNVPVKSDEIVYSEVTYMPAYDTSDTQMFDVKVINNISTI